MHKIQTKILWKLKNGKKSRSKMPDKRKLQSGKGILFAKKFAFRPTFCPFFMQREEKWEILPWPYQLSNSFQPYRMWFLRKLLAIGILCITNKQRSGGLERGNCRIGGGSQSGKGGGMEDGFWQFRFSTGRAKRPLFHFPFQCFFMLVSPLSSQNDNKALWKSSVVSMVKRQVGGRSWEEAWPG